MTPHALTTVVRECDVVDTLESIQHTVMVPDAFFVFEIFEVPDDKGIEAVTVAAKRRIDAERDYNMCVLYFWTIRQYRGLVERTGRPRGAVITQHPAPLSADDIEAVFKQLTLIPDFSEGIAVCTSGHDMTTVTLEAGEIRRT